MKIVHIIWFLSFCVVSFCIGFFFDGSDQKNTFINDSKNTKAELNITDPRKIIADIPEQGITQKPTDVLELPPNFVRGLPVVSAEVEKTITDESGRLGNQDGFNVFIKNIQTSFDPAKRQVSGSYILENFDERGLDTVFIQSLLVLPGKEESFPPYYFEPQKGEKFSISGKTEIKKNFIHPVPEGISGNNAQIIFELYLGSGDLVTFMESSKFDISGNSRFLSITHPRLVNSLTEAYLIGDGPTIYPNQEPKSLTFSYKIVNENKAAISVVPTLRVYNFSDNNPLILEEKLSSVVIEKGTSPTLSFPVPTMNYVPGIYVGKFLLLDANGRNLIPDVSLRWIIGGDIARIINIVNYTSSPTEGKAVDVDVEYVGTPPDTQKRVDNLQTKKDVLMSVQIENSAGMKISEIVKKNIPIYIGQRSAKIPFSVTPNFFESELFLRVIISDEKNILDEQLFSLAQSLRIPDKINSSDQIEEIETLNNQKFSNGKIFMVFLITCFIFMLFHAFFLKNHGFFIFLFCFFVTGVWYNNVDAYVTNCELANVSVTGPSPSETFWCGQTYTFTGGWWMNACANTDAAMIIDGNRVGYHEGLNCVRPGCEYNVRKYGTFAVDRTMPSDFRGRHVVRIGWSKSQGDCSNSGTETYAVNVSCPIDGACGSIHESSQLWPTSGTWCGVGTMSSWTQVGDVSNNNVWGWNCSGFDGGNTTSCYFVQHCPIGFVLNYGSCRLARCDSNPGINMSNTVPVTLSELPSTLPYTFTKDYTNTLVMNGSNTAENCEYTCANGYRADLTLNPQQCIPIVCTGNSASNALKCADDESNLSGNLDITRIRRANAGGCTGPQKCEWYCPADKPVYCPTRNECVTNNDDCGCPAGQKMCGNGQCILGNLTCPAATPAQCNNDGLCNNNESCDCSDCTNGDADDTDHCKNGLRCTRDDSQPACTEAACCPLGMNWNCDSNACVNSCGTHVPSELKAGIDIPFITCDAKTGSTHFRYQITKGSLVYTSDIYPSGTTVKHTGPIMDAGSYSVKCFYGTSASTIDTMIPALCDKTISVKPSTDTVQGCSGIYAHRGNTPSDEMTHNTAFDASFSCGSRLDVSSQNFPYKLTVGAQSPVYLQSDSFNLLGLGFVSLVSQKYTFSGSTDVTCAIKVGDGYSTNNSCKIRTCVGTNCSVPQTFVITPSKNALCTNLPDATYDIGCNEDSPQYAECVAWFYAGTSQKIRLNNNPPQNLTCTTSTPPGALSPVKTCTINLPSGGAPVTVFAGNADSFQTTIYSLTRDQKVPTGKIEFYTNYSSGTKLETSQYQFWQKQAVTAVVTCTDDPGPSDGSGCACASTLQENGTEQFWSSGRPSGDPKIGPDIMTYSRVFLNNSASASSVRVRDTAGLLSSPIPVSIGVDTVPPKVTVTVPANNRFSIVAQDSSEGGSGLWKPGSLRPIPAGITKNPTAPGILYKTFTKAAYLANPSALEFDEKCGLPAADNGDYYSFGQLTSAAALAAQTIPSTTLNGIRSTYAATTSMVAYCVQDNAGNVTRGVYPSDPVGCFSASNMDVIPNLKDTKIAARLGNATLTNEQRYGYGLSADLVNASCFRALISANISTLITNQFTPEVSADIAWDKSAYIKGLTPLKRNMSYYYYSNTTANPPAVTATTLTPIRKITNSPTGTGVKTVLVDGENIQINTNINYTGSDKILVLIARKNAKGAGGNILIDPSVTRIDAILIADGAILNAVNGSLRNSATPAYASSLTNRLIINGRLYSFNTRGGSLVASGPLIGPATGTLGKYFQNNILTATTPITINKSSEQDLERFRMIFADGNPMCSMHINYYITNTANLPPVLERPANFTGGTCSF